MKNITQKTVQSFAATALVLTCSMMTQAAPLTGSGNHLFITNSTPTNPAMQAWQLSNIVVDTSFDASWSSPALPAWHGTFSATGSVTGGTTGLVNTRMDFTTMPGAVLASGTYFNFGDLDGGSGSESFTLRAFDSSNNLIMTDGWLSEVIGVSGNGTGPGGTPDILDMPSWSVVNGEYSFVGNNAGSNPSTFITLESNLAISYLEVDRSSNFAGFSLGAPVPTPGTASLITLGGIMMTRRRRV